MFNINQVDYSWNYYEQKKEDTKESNKEHHGNQWNPYVNNSGSVMGKINFSKIFIIKFIQQFQEKTS
jgi:hypothetical protein